MHTTACWRTMILAAIALTPFVARYAKADDARSALEAHPDGWVDLLQTAGPSLKGWTRLPIPPEPKGKLGKPQWALDAASGTLVCEGDGGHDWLRWDEELADGVLHVEWRFTPVEGKKGYNSGIYARNSADGKIWHQAQTGSASGGFLFGESPVGGELKRVSFARQAKPSRVAPAGEWNTYEITFQGSRISLWVNGEVTSSWDNCETAKGYVGLEAEGYRIEFRNVKLKTLNK